MKELLFGSIKSVSNIVDKVEASKHEAARLAHEISTTADRWNFSKAKQGA